MDPMSKPPARPPQSAAPGWLALVANLPTEDPAARMRILRTLESLGAAVMREGVYLLPDTTAARQGLERLAEYIAKNTGTAQVLQVAASGEQQAQLQRLFDRSRRYEELIKDIDGLKLAFGVSEPGAIARVLGKQRREFEAIAALDFFPSEARSRAERALAEGEAAVRKLLFPSQGAPGMARSDEPLAGRRWATRRPLWADRLACAWLIRRFVDPEASLAWLDKSEPLPAGAVGFAFEGARFANSAARVTFEEMLARLGLAGNPALARIGTIVHFLEAGGAPVAEAAGVQTLLQGATRRAASDDELLREAEKTFDLLYDAYSDRRMGSE